MPDYDIEVTGLATPPVAAPVASYRPAVSVRNNGIHPANVSGTMRVYRREPPGELLGTFTLSLANLAAGATGTAQSSTFWTPAVGDIGREFLFTADVTTDNDQVEPNNHLGPTTVLIIPGEEPTPPAVTPHAPQHENGGTDELNIAGLAGQAADPQIPTDHETTHRAGAPDELNVANLHGVLYDDQRAQDHGNERHTPDMASSAELDAHALGTSAHADATNLANRAVSGDEEGLVKGDQLVLGSVVPASLYNALRADRYFGPAKHANVGSFIGGNIILTQSSGLSTILSLAAPPEYINADMLFIFEASGLLHIHADPGALLVLSSWFGTDQITQVDFPIPTAKDTYFSIRGAFMAKGATGVEGFLEIHTQLPTPTSPEYGLDGGGFGTIYVPGSPKTLTLKADLSDAHAETILTAYSGYIRALHPIA